MDQRPPMPRGMRAFVTFMMVAFFSVLALVTAKKLGLISGRTYMICFYSTGVIAGLSVWLQLRRPA